MHGRRPTAAALALAAIFAATIPAGADRSVPPLASPPQAETGAAGPRSPSEPARQAAAGAAEAPAPVPDRAALERRRGELEAAVAAAPGAAEPRVRLAETLAQLGAADEAIAAADRALEAGAAGELACDAHLAAAAAERGRGSPLAAARRYQLALAADSDRLPALTGLAVTLAQGGRYRDAIPVYGVWIQERPDDPVPRLGAATAMILAGEHARAKVVLEQAREAMPGNLDVLDLLARHLAASPDRSARDGARAVTLAEELVAEVPSAESHETLAMAYAEAGRMERAVEVQRRLLDERGAGADAATRARWQANLERYEGGQTCCADGG